MRVRSDQRQRGQAVVELALLVPVLFLILVGMLEFGRFTVTYLAVQHAAREGARLAITGAADAEIEALALAMLADLRTGTQDAQIEVQPPGGARLPGQQVTVRITYLIDLVNPIITVAGPDTWRLSARYTARVE